MQPPVGSKDPSQLPTATAPARSLFHNILQGSSLYALALVAPTVASMLLVPITTRCLTRTQFGVMDLLSQVNIVLSCLLSVNLSASLGYFYFGARDQAGRRSAIGTAILGSAALGAAAALVCLPFASFLSRMLFPGVSAAPYLRLVFVFLLPSFALDALFCWLRVENRSRMFVFASVLRVLVTIVFTVLLVKVFRLGIWGVLFSSASAILVLLLLLLIFWGRNMKPVLDPHLFLRMARFSLPLTTSAAAMFFLHFGDRFFLPHYRPWTDLAVYALAYKIGMVMSTLYGSFHVYWSAQVFPIMQRDDSQAVFRRISTYMVLTISLAGLALIVFSRPAVRILAPPAYWEAASLVPILVLAYFCRSIGDFFRCLFLVEGHPGYDAICTFVGAGVCLAGYVLMIPRYGIWGAAIATAIAFGVIAIGSVVWTRRVRHYAVDSPRLIKIGVALAAALAPHWLLRTAALPAQTGSATLSLALFFSVLCLLRFPTPGEWQLVRAAVRAGAGRWGAVRAAMGAIERDS